MEQELSCVVNFHVDDEYEGKEATIDATAAQQSVQLFAHGKTSVNGEFSTIAEEKKHSTMFAQDSGGDDHHGASAENMVDLGESALASVLDVVNGLSSSTIDSQRAVHGWNESVEKQTPWYIQVFRKFWGPVPWMIEAAMIISFVLGENENGGIIGFLLVVNACIALREEIKANKAVNELKEKLQIMARCKRDGHWDELASRELVPGDLIRVRHGDICPADVVILEGHVEADQSALTGESELKYLQKGRLCYAGSVLKKGEATSVVWATGEKTFFGLTAKLVQTSKPSDHVQAIMGVFVKYFMTAVIALILITIIVLAIRHDDIAAAVPLLLAVLVTALPVALPVIFTVSMAVGSQALVNHRVLVTRLNVLEDAPQMRILFSDKTGTLTLNKLSVQSLWTSAVQPPEIPCSSRALLFAALMCSRLENADPIDLAIFKRWDEEHSAPESSSGAELSTEVAAQSKQLFHTLDAKAYRCVRFLPFDAETRRTDATVVRAVAGGVECLRVMKGAVATICNISAIDKQSNQWQEIQDSVKQASAKGFRTIAVCAARLHLDHLTVDHFTTAVQDVNDSHSNAGLSSLFHSFTFLGILSFYDPPRIDTQDTLRSLNDLGIQVKMLTGDNHLVACEIARQLQFPGQIINLEEEKKKVRALAEDPSKATEEWVLSQVFAKFNPMSKDISGFAQIFPADKHAIVQYAQSTGIICGMTGDGVNDAPALKAAEVGVAMSNATDIAKMAASACLLAEGLSGILSLVRVGRIVHRRASVWLIYKVAKSLVHSIFILVFYLAIGYFPINTLQVIALLLLMDFALISIATDRQNGATQPTGWPLFQYFRIGFVLGILGAAEMMGIILYADYSMNLNEDQLNTLSFCLMFFFGFFNMLSCREKVFFWKSIPSNLINALFLIESLLVLLCCVFGIPGLTGIGAAWIFASIAVGAALFILDDFIKGIYSLICEKEFVKSG